MSPGQRSGPCGDTGRAETLAAAKPLDLAVQIATADRQARARRVQQMERAVTDARRRGDVDSVRLLTAWLDQEFVRRSYLRVVDPEIVRLRRELRRAA